jgi:ferredoxin-NADP reductase/DMSO/TMAO reductase YedYZ heme-binding membrane subunit
MSNIRFARLLVWINGAIPGVMLALDAWLGHLGANPTHNALLTTGLLALTFLPLSLLVTPLRRLSGYSELILLRRPLGLYAFFYASAHFLIFFGLEQSFNVAQTLHEMLVRKYLIVGSIALLAMLPLALTSTSGMVRRLGNKRWQLLHRLVYVAAIAGVVHYYMQAKADVRQPLAFASIVTALLLYRLVDHYIRLRRELAQLRHQPSPSAAPAAGAARRIKFWKGDLCVIGIFRETPDVKTFRLASPTELTLPFEFKAGQYLNVALNSNGTIIRRSYTIASSPAQRAYCEITVKRESQGASSRFLHDTVRVGDSISISAPAGNFTFDGQCDGIVLIGGGVGITPLMSVVRYLCDTAWKGQIDLVYGVRTENDWIFAGELQYLSSRFPNLHMHITLTRAEMPPKMFRTGRITVDLLKELGLDIHRRPIHLCGPTEMMNATRAALLGAAVPADNIRTEVFERAPSTSQAADESSTEMTEVISEPGANGDADKASAQADYATVAFSRSGKQLPCAPGTTVLELADDNGIRIPSDCRSGFCGTCKIKLRSGRVRMDVRDALSRDEEAKGLILACQSMPAGNVAVEA